MANLTITVADEVLKRARMRAVERGTSVNAVLREFLETYSGVRYAQSEAMEELMALSAGSEARRGLLSRPGQPVGIADPP